MVANPQRIVNAGRRSFASLSLTVRMGPLPRIRLLLSLIGLVIQTLPSAAATVTLVPPLAQWKYLATASAPAASWTNTGFNDASWDSGPGVLGFGESYIATPVPFGPNANDKYRTTYFRRSFTVTAPESLGSLSLAARYDDGFVAYLNGVEVLRSGLPTGSIAYTTLAAPHEGTAYESFNLSAFLGTLVTGSNVLAIELHQTSASSTDLVWDAGLTATSGPAVVQMTRGPYLQGVTPNQATIRWRTSMATPGQVQYGSSAANLDQVIDVAASTIEHEVTIAGLTPGTRFFYSVGMPGTVLAGGDALHTFRTSPLPGTPGRSASGRSETRDEALPSRPRCATATSRTLPHDHPTCG